MLWMVIRQLRFRKEGEQNSLWTSATLDNSYYLQGPKIYILWVQVPLWNSYSPVILGDPLLTRDVCRDTGYVFPVLRCETTCNAPCCACSVLAPSVARHWCKLCGALVLVHESVRWSWHVMPWQRVFWRHLDWVFFFGTFSIFFVIYDYLILLLLLNQMYHRIILELARGIQAGDAVWFERVVQQLRGVLLERQNDAALMEVAASAPSTSTFPLAERKMEVKEVKEDVLEEDLQQNWFFGGFVVCLVHVSSFWYSVLLEEVTLKSMCLGTTTAAKIYDSHTNSLGLTC